MECRPAGNGAHATELTATHPKMSFHVTEIAPGFRELWSGIVIRWAWRTGMAQPDVATFLTDHRISKAFQHPDHLIPGHATGEFHAAANGISSSLT